MSNFCFGWLAVKWCGKEVQIVKRVKVIWVHNHKLCGNTSSKNLPSKQAKALFEWRISKKRLKWTKKIITTRGSLLVQLKWTKETIATWGTSLVHHRKHKHADTENITRLIGWKRVHFSCNTNENYKSRTLTKFRLSLLSGMLVNVNY